MVLERSFWGTLYFSHQWSIGVKIGIYLFKLPRYDRLTCKKSMHTTIRGHVGITAGIHSSTLLRALTSHRAERVGCRIQALHMQT